MTFNSFETHPFGFIQLAILFLIAANVIMIMDLSFVCVFLGEN
jgi:hypothetical protein